MEWEIESTSFLSCIGLFNALVLLGVLRRLRHILAVTADSKALNTASKQDTGLGQLRSLWLEARTAFMPEIDADPYMSPPAGRLDTLLSHYLAAEKGDAEKAAGRLVATAVWRQEYRCIDLHQPGIARRLFMHGSNAGAAMYFGDYGLRDRSGEPVLVGRNLQVGALKPADRMVPCTHLRAAMLVVERVACECRHGASYILDLGPPTRPDMAAVLAGRGRYWDADGAVDGSSSIGSGRAPSPSVGPHLAAHLQLHPGLPTLKEALRIITAHYPALLHRIYFYRPDAMFHVAYAIFSLWLPSATRAKLVMVRQGEEHRHFFSEEAPGGGLDAACAPPELGGFGPSLGGDAFLAAAVKRYDSTCSSPFTAS